MVDGSFQQHTKQPKRYYVVAASLCVGLFFSLLRCFTLSLSDWFVAVVVAVAMVFVVTNRIMHVSTSIDAHSRLTTNTHHLCPHNQVQENTARFFSVYQSFSLFQSQENPHSLKINNQVGIPLIFCVIFFSAIHFSLPLFVGFCGHFCSRRSHRNV